VNTGTSQNNNSNAATGTTTVQASSTAAAASTTTTANAPTAIGNPVTTCAVGSHADADQWTRIHLHGLLTTLPTTIRAR
jgi:hypothetical protein